MVFVANLELENMPVIAFVIVVQRGSILVYAPARSW